MAKSPPDGSQTDPTPPTTATAPKPTRKPRKRTQDGPTPFQRVREAQARGRGIKLDRAEVQALYWRAGLDAIAAADDLENRPAELELFPRPGTGSETDGQ